MLIAIGRKMTDLADFSAMGLSLSTSTATSRPKATMAAGATMIHSTLLISGLVNRLA